MAALLVVVKKVLGAAALMCHSAGEGKIINSNFTNFKKVLFGTVQY